MLRFLTVSVFAATLCVAGILYKIKYDTRSLQRQTVVLRKQISQERLQLAVLKAEWSILTHPRRVDELAASLGLKPLTPEQIISFQDLDSLPFKKGKSLADIVQEKQAVIKVHSKIGESLDVFASETFVGGFDVQ